LPYGGRGGALARYAALLKRYRVAQVEAVATSAVREAANGPAFVARVRARLGIPLRILSGREEARLIYRGVAQTRRQATVVVAIGGGSAQVAVGQGGRCRYTVSRPLGGSRLAQQFIHRDPPDPAEVAALEAHVRRAWRPIARAVRRHRWTQAIGSSVAIAQVVAAARAVRPGQAVTPRRPTTVTRPALQRLAAWLAEHTAGDRRALAGVDPRRQELLLPTAVVLLTWMEACGVSRVRYAPGSLREGLIENIRRGDAPREGLSARGGDRPAARPACS